MNDAFRGAVIVGAVVAFYFAVRLCWVHARTRRRHIRWHVLPMTLALLVTSGLICARLLVESGSNEALVWWDLLRTVQVSLLVAGLRPLWAHHRDRPNRAVDAQ